MSCLSSLFPQTVLRTSSRYNPDIAVIREWGGYKLLVSGSRQSGPYIRKLWERAFETFHLERLIPIRSILVLGIGGGTVIELLATRFSRATITAVDIDQTMIDIANRYFRLDQTARLHTLRQDADAFVRKEARGKKKYDLVIVDLFIGREIPAFVRSGTFYHMLKRVLAPGGIVILNYLRELAYQQKSDVLFLTLKRLFREVYDYPIANNRFFFAGT